MRWKVIIFIIGINIIVQLSNAGDVHYIEIPTKELDREVENLIENLKKKKIPKEQIDKEVSNFIGEYIERLREEKLYLHYKQLEKLQKEKEMYLQREQTTGQERAIPNYSGLDKPKSTIPTQLPSKVEESSRIISPPKQADTERTSIVPAVVFGIAIVGALCTLLLRKRK